MCHRHRLLGVHRRRIGGPLNSSSEPAVPEDKAEKMFAQAKDVKGPTGTTALLAREGVVYRPVFQADFE